MPWLVACEGHERGRGASAARASSHQRSEVLKTETARGRSALRRARVTAAESVYVNTNITSMLGRTIRVARRALVPRTQRRAASGRAIPDKPPPYPPPPPGLKEATTGPIRGASAATTGGDGTTGKLLPKQEKAFAFSPAKNAAVALGLCGFVFAVYYQTIAAIRTGSQEELGDEWDAKNEKLPDAEAADKN